MRNKAQERYHHATRIAGKRLWNLTLGWSKWGENPSLAGATKEARNLRGRKKFRTYKRLGEVVEILLGYAEEIREERRTVEVDGRRLSKREVRHVAPLWFGVGGRHRDGSLTVSPWRHSLENRRMYRRERLVYERLNLPTYSGDTDDGLYFDASVESARAWTDTEPGETYSKRTWYRRTDAVHTLHLDRDWYMSVYKRGLRTVGGMLTLAADLVRKDAAEGDNLRVYRACWVVNRRGKTIGHERGYIACSTAPNGRVHRAHGRTITGAIRSARMQAGIVLGDKQIQSEILDQIYRMSVEEADALLSANGSVRVRMKHSTDAGNCESGTRSFAERYLQEGATSATVDEILPPAWRNRWLRENSETSLLWLARKACLFAILRQQRSKNQAAA